MDSQVRKANETISEIDATKCQAPAYTFVRNLPGK